MWGLHDETDKAIIPRFGIVHQLVTVGKFVEIVVDSCHVLARLTFQGVAEQHGRLLPDHMIHLPRR